MRYTVSRMGDLEVRTNDDGTKTLVLSNRVEITFDKEEARWLSARLL
jgi:hypothetical protein